MMKSEKGKKMAKSDEEAKQLAAFMKNVESIDGFRESYQGYFVAIFEQKVVGYDTEYRSLVDSITPYLHENELYVGYIPKSDEVLVV